MKPPRKSGRGGTPKAAPWLNLSPPRLGHSSPHDCPSHCPQPDGSDPLGPPLTIQGVAKLIGCSTWTVRQTLMPRGLPYFRSGGGKLLFYTNQITRWLMSQQKG